MERIVESPIACRLARGAFWGLAGALITRGLQLLSVIIVARTLGIVGFGEFGVLQNTISMGGAVSGLGLGLTATKYVAEYRNADKARAGRMRALSSAAAWIASGIAAVTVFIISPWLSKTFLAAPHLSSALRIGACLLFLSSVNGAQMGVLAGFEAFKSIARISLWSGVSSLPLVAGGVYLWGLHGALWGLVVSTGIAWALNHIAIRQECTRFGVPYTYNNCLSEKAVLWKFALPSALNGAMMGPVIWLTSALLVNQPHGYAEMGVYNAVFRVKQIPEMILSMIAAPILPILSDQLSNRNYDGISKTLKYASHVSLICLVPASLALIGVPQLAFLPFGRDFQANTAVVQLLMLQSMMVGIFFPFGQLIVSMGRMWFGWVYNLLFGLCLILIALVSVPAYGAAGLAGAMAVAYGVTSLGCVLFMQYYKPDLIPDIHVRQSIIWALPFVLTAFALSRCLPALYAAAGAVALAAGFSWLVIMRGSIRRPTIAGPTVK